MFFSAVRLTISFMTMTHISISHANTATPLALEKHAWRDNLILFLGVAAVVLFSRLSLHGAVPVTVDFTGS